ncbi:MAG: acyltransferase [Ruminococcaceae bacterium]|nr:acyltransferase [Oscillospiraceae bacterium]
MKKYPLIDVFRFLCACLVIMIHCDGVDGNPISHMIVTCFSRQAVPFFFIVSGFFFCRKLKSTADPKSFVIGYAKRLILFYFIWAIISLPEVVQTYLALYKGSSPVYIALVIVRRVIFAGSGVYWYLLVTLEAALICGFLIIKKWEKLMYIIAAFGIVACFFYSADFDWFLVRQFNDLIYTVFSWSNNVFMLGIPFFAVGCFFTTLEGRIKLNTPSLCVAYFAVSAAGIVAFSLVYDKIALYEKYFFLFPLQAVLLFMIGISSKISIKDSICSELRNISSTVYCVHCFFIGYVLKAIWVNEFAPVWIGFLLPLTLSVVLYYIVKIIGFKPLFRLITLK